MSVAAEPLVPLPLDGADHYHTGCFHVECPLPGGLALYLVGGLPYPRLAAGRLAVRPGQRLLGFVRPPRGAAGGDPAALMRSGALDGLAVEWAESDWAGGPGFTLQAETKLLAAVAERVQAWAAVADAEP